MSDESDSRAERPSYTDRDRYRAELKSILQSADDEGVVELLWAANVLQSEAPEPAKRLLKSYPLEAVSNDWIGRWTLYKWEIEDLVNELFTIPKRPLRPRQRLLDYRSFASASRLAGILRELHNAEDGIDLSVMSVLREMKRISAKQFDWQRGYLNKSQFYRSAYIYGQGACASYFSDAHGITVNDLSLVGFGLFATLMSQPVISPTSAWEELGVSEVQVHAALKLLCLSAEEARRAACEMRKGSGHSAYRPSFLRRHPCIRFGNIRIRSPLPQLIVERITAGLFFDVIDGGGEVRRDYGRRFELYCIGLLAGMLPGLDFAGEFRYGRKGFNFDSPDILCSRGEAIEAALECKATRMSFAARFAHDPLSERGYEDVVKAVFQLWRFFSHCRRGIASRTVSDTAVGVVLTLDPWLTMAGPLYEEILLRARAMAADDEEISDGDCRPIEFCSITDLESALTYATPNSFLSALKAGARRDRFGWIFSSIHDEYREEGRDENSYPFADKLGEVLPWWDAFAERIEERRKGQRR